MRLATVASTARDSCRGFRSLSGSIDYLVKLVVADIAHYDDVYKRLIRVAPLADVTSSFAMEKIKDTTELPI